jgi:hypothetical protein
LGAYRQGDSTGWSGAFQTTLPFGLEVALEHYRFPDGNAYTSVGAGYQVNSAVYLYTYYSRHNQTRDNDLFDSQARGGVCHPEGRRRTRAAPAQGRRLAEGAAGTHKH